MPKPLRIRTALALLRASVPAIPALLGALMVAGCLHGDDGAANGGPRAAAELAAEAFAAVSEQTGARYSLDVELRIETNGDADGRLALIANTPIKLHFDGAVSRNAVTGDLSATIRRVPFTARIVAGRRELFIRFMGRWYGSRKTGIGELERWLEAQARRNPGVGEPLRSEDGIRRSFDEIFTGRLRSGPELDGTSTREFQGRPNAAGIEGLSVQNGGRLLTPAESERLAVLTDDVRVRLAVGDDGLPRRLELRSRIPPADIGSLVTPGSALAGVESVSIDARLDLSDWGDEVSYERPSEFEPLSRILGGIVE